MYVIKLDINHLKVLSHLENKKNLKLIFLSDRENKRISITDARIKITTAHLNSNLGTTKKSGTRHTMQMIEGITDLSLIDQFYVGFFQYFWFQTELFLHQNIMKVNTSDKVSK
jgi:HSP90 family molecular chaperone